MHPALPYPLAYGQGGSGVRAVGAAARQPNACSRTSATPATYPARRKGLGTEPPTPAAGIRAAYGAVLPAPIRNGASSAVSPQQMTSEMISGKSIMMIALFGGRFMPAWIPKKVRIRL